MSGNCTRFRLLPVTHALFGGAALTVGATHGVRTPFDLAMVSFVSIMTVLAVRAIPPVSVRIDGDQLRVRWPWGRTHAITADDVTRMRIDVNMARARFLVRSTSLRLFQVDADRAAEPLTAIEAMCTWAAEVSDDRDSTAMLREAAESASERRAYIEAGDQHEP